MNQANLSQIRHRMEQIKNYTSVSADVYVHDVELLLDLVTPRPPGKPPANSEPVIVLIQLPDGAQTRDVTSFDGAWWHQYGKVLAWWPLPPVGELVK